MDKDLELIFLVNKSVERKNLGPTVRPQLISVDVRRVCTQSGALQKEKFLVKHAFAYFALFFAWPHWRHSCKRGKIFFKLVRHRCRVWHAETRVWRAGQFGSVNPFSIANVPLSHFTSFATV